jgi:hypothetical protein
MPTLGGDRQFHLVRWQSLGGISAEEHAHIFLHEPRGVIGSKDHTCVEAQRRIGKPFFDTVCIYEDAGIVAKRGIGPDRRGLFLQNLAHHWHIGSPKSPAKQQL